MHDCSLKVSGQQCIHTVDGYVHLLTFRHGLPYVKIRPYTDVEWDTLPKVVWTSDVEWDPSVLDGEPPDEDTWYDAISDFPDGIPDSPFDEFGRYKHRSVDRHCLVDGEVVPALSSDSLRDVVEDASTFHTPYIVLPDEDAAGHQIQCQLHKSELKAPNYAHLHPFFLDATTDVIKCTFEATTQ